MTATKPYLSLVPLVLLNAVAVFGVLAFGWDGFDIIFLYWTENLIVGGFMVLRMLLRHYRDVFDFLITLVMAPFFAVHFGAFCMIHGVVVIALFGEGVVADTGASLPNPFLVMGPVLVERNLTLAVAALVLLHFIEYVRDHARRGGGDDRVADLMFAPYKRLVVLHLAIMTSGFALDALDAPVAGSIALVVLKTGFDVYYWVRAERASRGAPEAAGRPPDGPSEVGDDAPRG